MLPPYPLDEPSLDFRFARTRLDRRADLREDAAALARLAADPSARTVVLEETRVIVARRSEGGADAGLESAVAAGLAPPEAEPIFLGLAEGIGWFALPLADAEAPLPSGLEAIELRALAVAGDLPADQYGALATGRALLHWHRSHRFCARCGAASRPASAGWKRSCPSCGTEHFPRTDPVVIMLVEDGDRCLLGRGHAFPEGMWSCLAGFMEPGETIEAAVRRETLEEAGIRVGSIAYVASEPWPFPGSLMIGMRARALDRTIRRDPIELADCRWFDRDEARLMLERRHPDGLFAPPPIAMAHHLLRAFVETP